MFTSGGTPTDRPTVGHPSSLLEITSAVPARLESRVCSWSVQPSQSARCSTASAATSTLVTPAGWSPARRAAPQAAMQRQQATLVAANLRGYLAPALATPPDQLPAFHDELLTRMVARVAEQKAITDGISGDRFDASVNGAKPAVAHRAKGVRLAWALAAPPDAAPPRSGPASPLRHGGVDGPAQLRRIAGGGVSCGVCAGEMRCGAIGCTALRRYSFIGPTAGWVHAAERLATAWCAAAVANGAAQADAQCQFLFRLACCAAMAKASHAKLRPQKLWEVKGECAKQDAGEWMYQLEGQEGVNPWQHYNNAKLALYGGAHAAALRDVELGRQAVPGMDAEWDELGVEIALRRAHAHTLLHDAWLAPPPPEPVVVIMNDAEEVPPPRADADADAVRCGGVVSIAAILTEHRVAEEEVARTRSGWRSSAASPTRSATNSAAHAPHQPPLPPLRRRMGRSTTLPMVAALTAL